MSGEADSVAWLRARLEVRQKARARERVTRWREALDAEIAELEATLDELITARELASG
jgi:hypothetical protein